MARRSGNWITPIYAELTGDNLEVAERLIRTYRSHVGAKKAVLKEFVADLEDLGYDYRYVRGLSVLLDRRCTFRSSVTFNPAEVRFRLFELANKTGLPADLEARRRILEGVASELNLTIGEIESSFYADLDDELILEEFNTLEAESLVKWYNLGLIQTLLFNSTEARFTAAANWQRIFRDLKRLGLIYEVWSGEGGYWVKVDGPLSLFKLNRRYGTALAKLLPTVIAGGGWIVEAKILRGGLGEMKRLLDFRIESRRHERLLEAEAFPSMGLDVYDSEVERDFAVSFKALDTGWRLRREPEPIPVGEAVIIPDFSFERGEAKVYMEVVGFWTPEYLKRKVEKLGLLKGIDMIVAVDKELACRRTDKLGKSLDVTYFKGRIPLRPVLSHLREVEESLKRKEMEKASTEDFLKGLDEQVIDVRELADKLGVMEDTARELMRERSIPGYIALSSILIRESKLKEIDDKLKERLAKGEMSLDEASTLIEMLGGRNPTVILETLGYNVKWHGIDPKNAKVEE